ncbi:Uncharacterized protein OBRU01_25121, partial [Operophtera brumata]
MMDLLISHRQEEKEKPESSVDFDLSGIWEDEPDDNIKILLNQQKCNYKALERAMTKIKIELISEKWELEVHLSTLKGKWDSIDKLHWKLENAVMGSNLNAEYSAKFENIENKYDDLRKQLNNKVWSNIHYQKSTTKIEIPELFGDYVQWIAFKDLFLETIHKNPTIS